MNQEEQFMEKIDLESQVSSEDEVLGDEKLVPVSEAIRYRKRAQNAEKEAAGLEQQLKLSMEKNEQLAGQLDKLRFEQKVATSLTKAGVKDMEAAVLIIKARMESEDQDVDSVIDQLRKEKGYLFSDMETSTAASKTAGVKQRTGGGQAVLENSAKRAAVSGSRTDVHDYMRVRRQFVK